MCGIFGVITQETSLYQLDQGKLFSELLFSNLSRGGHSIGVLSIGPESEIVLRRVSPPGEDFSFPVNQVLLGHDRAPTGGGKGLLDTHPFQTDRFYLAMNGILTSYRQEPEDYLGAHVDSAYLLGAIDRTVKRSWCPPSEDITHILNTTRGQFACWMWDRWTQNLYLWRVMSPIWVTSTEGGQFLFSSIPVQPELSWKLLDEGIIYKLSFDQEKDLLLETVGSFLYENIYFRSDKE